MTEKKKILEQLVDYPTRTFSAVVTFGQQLIATQKHIKTFRTQLQNDDEWEEKGFEIVKRDVVEVFPKDAFIRVRELLKRWDQVIEQVEKGR